MAEVIAYGKKKGIDLGGVIFDEKVESKEEGSKTNEKKPIEKPGDEGKE